MDQQFRAALSALFGQDPIQQEAANLWLNDFAKKPEAWGCAMALLDTSSGATLEQAFFAANLLTTKTRTEWGRLTPQQRSELAEAYGAKLRAMLLPTGASSATPAACVPPVLVDRLALLASTSAALGGLATVERHMALAQDLAAAARPALASSLAAERAGGEALLRTALLVLQQVAEEAAELDSGRGRALLAGENGGGGLAAHRAGVVAMAREAMATAAGPGACGAPSFPLLVAALRSLSAWVRMDGSGGSGAGLSPAELEAVAPGLLTAALGLLALPPAGPPTSSPLSASVTARQQQQPAAATYAAVADLATDVLGPGGGTCTATAGGEAADAAATAAAVDVLLRLGRRLAEAAAAEAKAEADAGTGGCDGGAALAALVAWVRVAVAVAERNTAAVATGSGNRSVELASGVVAALAACPGRLGLAEACVDYFLALNTVPTAERHPALRAPLYGALLPHVLRTVSYPPGFVDWDSTDEDEEAFYRFREQQAADLLESMYGQCRTEMVQHLVAEATNSGPSTSAAAAGGGAGAPGGYWQGPEAALFALRAIHVQVKAGALGGRAGALDKPEAADTAARLNASLSHLFGDICSPSGRVAGLLTVPWVCLGVARLIAEYATWLGKVEGAPLQAALGFLLRALSVPQAAAAAAQGFRNCCVRGADQLTREPAVLSALAGAAMAAVAPPPPPGGGAAAAVPLGTEERSAVVEGLSRLASKLPAAAAAEAGCSLMAPCVARAQSVAAAAAAAGGPLSASTLTALAEELVLMTAVVRFLELPAPGGSGRGPGLPRRAPGGAAAAAAAAQGEAAEGDHPALRALQVAWPVLSAVASEPQCQADPRVVEALAELYKRSLLSTRRTGRPLLPPLITALLGLLRAHPHAAVLDCLATVVELFGEAAGGDEARALQATALQGSAEMMGALMASLQAQQQKQMLDQLGTMVELFEEAAGGDKARALQATALQGSAEMMGALMASLKAQQQQQGGAAAAVPFPSSSSPGELAAAFFTLADRYLIFAREVVLSGPAGAALPALVEWACGVLTTMREREPVAAALSFLTHLLSATARAAAEAEAGAAGRTTEVADAATVAATETCARLDALWSRCGARLVASLLVAGTDTAPSQLMRPLAGCLAALLSLADAGGPAGPGAVPGVGEWAVRRELPGWLAAAWQLPSMAELLESGALGEEGVHARRFTELLLQGRYPAPAGPTHHPPRPAAPLQRSRLDALVADFFSLSRGAASADVMLAYDF